MQIYDRRKINDKVNQKWVRVITVLVYIVSISIVALVLGLYYRFVWRPNYEANEPDAHTGKQVDQAEPDFEVSLGEVNIVNLGQRPDLIDSTELGNIIANAITDNLARIGSNLEVLSTQLEKPKRLRLSGSKSNSVKYSIKINFDQSSRDTSVGN